MGLFQAPLTKAGHVVECGREQAKSLVIGSKERLDRCAADETFDQPRPVPGYPEIALSEPAFRLEPVPSAGYARSVVCLSFVGEAASYEHFLIESVDQPP